jgi:hypothetical protein
MLLIICTSHKLHFQYLIGDLEFYISVDKIRTANVVVFGKYNIDSNHLNLNQIKIKILTWQETRQVNWWDWALE